MVTCKNCGSSDYIKNGFVRGKQRYRCSSCSLNFVEGDERQRDPYHSLRSLCVFIYSLSKGTFRGLAEICGISPPTVYRWVRDAAGALPEPEVDASVREVEIDEMWHFLTRKGNKRWILKAIDRQTGHVIAWVVGGRDEETVKRLSYAKLEHLKEATFSFAAVLPKDQHVIGKTHTVSIERNNSNTRHRLARMTRRTKVVSHSEKMIDLSMRLFSFFKSRHRRIPWIQSFLTIFP